MHEPTLRLNSYKKRYMDEEEVVLTSELLRGLGLLHLNGSRHLEGRREEGEGERKMEGV